MVIVCPECSTKFRVKPERIPEQGAKVRCARCKHVFLAQKPVAEEEPAPVIEEVLTVDEPTGSNEQAGETETITEEEQPSVDFSTDQAEDNAFSYDQFRELDTTKTTDEDFTFSGSPEQESAKEDAPVVESFEQTEDDSFSFSGADDEPSEPGQEPIEKITDSIEPKKSVTEETIASIFADNEPDQTQADEFIETNKTEPQKQTPETKSTPASSIIRVLLLLILGLVIVAGALYYVNGPDQINQVIQQIFGQQTEPAENGRVSLADLEGKFVNNQDAGELFVIRGEATNNYKETRAAIQVKGVIFDQNGNPLLQKTIFCGNTISDQELQTLPFSKLEEMMRNQFGKAMNNMQVNSKETIPFVIAFRDLPKDLSEFSVDVTSSEPVTK